MTSVLVIMVLSIVSCAAISDIGRLDEPVVTTDLLEPSVRDEIDFMVSQVLPQYRHINLAVVADQEIKYTASYGHNRIDSRDILGSVSKPVTATVVCSLLSEGAIDSLDDPIGRYDPRYDDVMPAAYVDTPITLRHLLTHTSGLPHESSIWDGGVLALSFEPGTSVQYSTNAYGVLGEVMETATGMSFDALVKHHIGEKVGADSFRADDVFFDTPGGRVWATIADLARFTVGIVESSFYPASLLAEEVLNVYAADPSGQIGLGWYIADAGAFDVALYHAGSNGAPRAFIAVEPFTGRAVCLTGRNVRRNGDNDFGALTIQIMSELGGL